MKSLMDLCRSVCLFVWSLFVLSLLFVYLSSGLCDSGDLWPLAIKERKHVEGREGRGIGRRGNGRNRVGKESW